MALSRTGSDASSGTATWTAPAGPLIGGQATHAHSGAGYLQEHLDIDDKLADMYSLHMTDSRLVDEHLPMPIITADDMPQHLVLPQCCSSCQLLRAEGEKLHDSIVTMQDGARLEPQQAQQAGKIHASSSRRSPSQSDEADGMTLCRACL